MMSTWYKAFCARYWSYFHGTTAWILIGVIVLGIVAIAWNSPTWFPGGDTTLSSLILTALTVVAIMMMVGTLAHSRGGKLSSLIIGYDNRTSTSKTQYLIWTASVAAALLYIGWYALLAGTPYVCSDSSPKAGTTFTHCVPGGTIWEQYIILLGVPSATAVIAKAVVTTKIDQNTLQKPPGGAGSASVHDLFSDDTGQTDLIDTQYLVFNLVALVYFIANFISYTTFADIPPMLLGLTSTAAGTYVLGKVTQSNPPTILSAYPTLIRPGQKVLISGSNLFPDRASTKVQVLIGGVVADPSECDPSAGTFSFTAPSGMDPNLNLINVQTSAGAPAKYGPITIAVADSIIGWVGEVPRPGQQAKVGLAFMPKSAIMVQVGDIVLPKAITPVNDGAGPTISFGLPDVIPSGKTIDISLRQGGELFATGELAVA